MTKVYLTTWDGGDWEVGERETLRGIYTTKEEALEHVNADAFLEAHDIHYWAIYEVELGEPLEDFGRQLNLELDNDRRLVEHVPEPPTSTASELIIVPAEPHAFVGVTARVTARTGPEGAIVTLLLNQEIIARYYVAPQLTLILDPPYTFYPGDRLWYTTTGPVEVVIQIPALNLEMLTRVRSA